jgi:hypothetical protein
MSPKLRTENREPRTENFSRRALLSRASTGFGMAALAGLMQEESQAALMNRAKRFAPKARSVIFLYMSGGVSHVDSFDHKPMLKKFEGKPMPGRSKRRSSTTTEPSSHRTGTSNATGSRDSK